MVSEKRTTGTNLHTKIKVDLFCLTSFKHPTMKIGFIGQGFIGKNYADDFENRKFEVIRYALEEPYKNNRVAIKSCDIVFIAVPTPTTPHGSDDSILRSVIPLIGDGKIAVVKSTILPGTTESLQKLFPQIILLHSPEFLVESTAASDAAKPTRNIIGIPQGTETSKEAAETVLSILPKAPFSLITTSRESELIKYAANCFLYTKVLFANMFFDIAQSYDCEWDNIKEALGADPRIGPSHLKVNDASRHPGAKAGRGAGGHCFIKDFAAICIAYKQLPQHDNDWFTLLKTMEEKNVSLLKQTGKDLDILDIVYNTKTAQ